MTQHIQSVPLRPLGHMERYQLSKHLRRSAGPVIVAASLRLPPFLQAKGDDPTPQAEPSFWHRLLAPALADLCSQCPPLSLVVCAAPPGPGSESETNAADGWPRFAGLAEAIRVSDVAQCSLSTAHWDSDQLALAIESEMHQDFDIEDHHMPLWRVRVLWHPDRPDECCLLWVWDHVLADGLSGKWLLRGLVHRLPRSAALAKEDADDDLGSDEIKPFDFASNEEFRLAVAYDQRQPPAPSAWTLSKVILKEKLLPARLRSFFFPSPPYWAGQAAPPLEATHHTRITIITAPPQLCTALRAEGKKHGVTLHSIFFTACATAVRSTFEVPDSTYLKAATPISARRFCTPPVDASEVGNFVGSVETLLPPPSTRTVSASENDDETSAGEENQRQFWERCVSYGRHLSASLHEGAALPGLLAYVGEWPSDWERLQRARADNNESTLRRTGSFELSDLGVWEDRGVSGVSSEDVAGEESDWKVSAVTFGQSVHVNGMALLCSAVCSEEGGMRATVAWQDGTLDEASVKQFAREVESVLASLTSQPQ